MKRLLLFSLAIIFAFQGLLGQTITIGSGTNGSSMLPFSSTSGFSFSQQIVNESEIATQAGMINSISFQYISPTPQVADSITIYIGNTTKSTFSSQEDWVNVSSMTEVFSGSISLYNIAPNNWVDIELETPFQWDGVSNIVISVLDNNTSAIYGLGNTFYTHTSNNKTLNYTSYSYPININFLGSGTLISQRNNIQLNFGASNTCYKPSLMTSSNISQNSANILWMGNNSASQWEIEYKTNTDTSWTNATAITANDTFTSLNNLIPNSNYNLRIRANCSPTNKSSWLYGYFQTECNTISTLPYNESFDTYGSGTTVFPNCWSKISSNNYPNISSSGYSSPSAIYLYAIPNQYNYLISPSFESSIPINSLSLNCKLYKSNNTSNLIIGVISDITDTNTFISIDTISPLGLYKWEVFNVNFSNYTGLGNNIAFKLQGEGFSSAISLDDVIFYESLSCDVPSGLSCNTNISTPNSIELNWNTTSNDNTLSWILEYRTSGSEIWQRININSNPYTLSGLLQNGYYEIRLAAICSDGDTTFFCQPIEVGLPCQRISVFPWNEGFEGVWFPASGVNTGSYIWCWTNINGGDNSNYYSKWNPTTDTSYVHSGTKAVQISKSGSSGIGNNDWLISPVIFLRGSERISFWAKTQYSTTLDLKILNISEHGGIGNSNDTNLFEELKSNIFIQEGGWREFEFNLSEYNGEFQIAFVKNGNENLRLSIDDIMISEIPVCARPTEIKINYITNSEIKLSWTPGNTNDTSWYLFYKKTNETYYDSILIQTNPNYVLQNLDPANQYNIYLRTNCIESNETTFPITISTSSCNSISTLPYTESFDNYGANIETFPNCWINSSYYSSYLSRINYSGPNSLFINQRTKFIILPPISNSIPINTLRAKFKLKREYYEYDFSIGVMSNPDDYTTFQEIDNLSPTSQSSWENFEVDFHSYSGEGTYIAFAVDSSNVYIDDIEISQIPNCKKPTEVFASNISINSAVINWTSLDSTSNAWWLFYMPSSSSNYDSIHITSNPPYTLQNLNSNTSYTIFIKTDCGNQTSEQSSVSSFITLCGAINSLPYFEGFEEPINSYILQAPQCWISTAAEQYNPYLNYGGKINQCLSFSSLVSGNYNIVSMPVLDSSIPIDSLVLRFYLKTDQINNKLLVGIMSNPNDTNTFVAVDTIQLPINNLWTLQQVFFNSYSGQGRYIAFKNIYDINPYSSITTFIDEVSIDKIASCSNPNNIQISDITQSTANISFSTTNANNNQWKILYRELGSSTWIEEVINSTSHQLTGLISNTDYELFVRSFCIDSTYSNSSLVVNFHTECNSITSLPYKESFDYYATQPNSLSYNNLSCWQKGIIYNNSSTNSNTSFSATGSLYFNRDGVAITPIVDTSIDLSTIMVKFKMNSSILNDYGIQVGVMTDPNNFSTFIPVGNIQQTFSSNTWEDKQVLFSNYSGNGKYIAIISKSQGSENSFENFAFYLDDFIIDYIPNCPTVNNFNTSARTTTSVNLSWDNDFISTSGWEIAFSHTGLSDFDTLTATILQLQSTTSIPYIHTGLTSGTTYTYSIRNACGGKWSLPKEITLPTSTTSVPYAQFFSDTNSVSGWEFSSSAYTKTDMWCIGNATGNPGSSMYVSSNGGVNNSYSQTSTFTYASIVLEFGQTADFNLSFDWKGTGDINGDYLSVYNQPYGIPMTENDYPIGRRIFISEVSQSNWQNVNIYLNPSIYANTVQRLIFVWHSDNNTIVNPPAAVDNIIITSMSCARPINLIANNITTQSANISWAETGNATSWYLYYKPYDAFNYDSILVSNNPSYTLNNLIPNKGYLVYIKSNCNNQLSHSSEIFNFNTECSTISSLPFTEDFNIYYGGLVPYCWNRIDSYTDDPFNQQIYHSYPRSLRFYTAMDEYNYSILPEIDASIPVNSLMLSFWIKKSNLSSRLIIGVMDSLDINSFVAIDTIAPSDTTNWEEFEINLNTYSGTGNFIAFKSEYNAEANYLYIDDIYLDYIPSCARPNSVTITPITETSISVNFTSGNNVNNQWWVYYKPISSTYWDSTLTTQNSTTLNNLSLQTKYQIYIKTLCEDTIFSNPTSIITYTTPCITYPIASFPWIESFENGINCWRQEIISGGANWTEDISNTSSHSGLNYAFLNNNIGNRTKLISQTLDISSLNRPYLSFWHKQYYQGGYYTNYQDSLKVYYRSDTNNTTQWIELFNFNSNIPFYRRDSIALPNPTSTYQIAFEGYGGGGEGVFLDDIKVFDSVPCIMPQSITSIPSLNSVSLSWSAGGNENSWEVRLGENGIAQTTNNNSNFNITGLSSGTTYTVYIRSVCGATNSSWAQTSFTTIQSTQVTTIPASNITQTSATFLGSFIQGTSPIDTIGFEFRKTNSTNWELITLSNIVTPFTFQINTLDPNTSYLVRAYVFTLSEGKLYGDTIGFTTPQVVRPTVSTGVPSVDNNQVTFTGTIIQGSEPINSRGFEYKQLSENWTEAVNISAQGTENISAVVEILQSNDYEVRAYARTESDKYYGDTIPFSTIDLVNLEGEKISLILYPNPASEETELVITGLKEEINIALIDLYGRVSNTMLAKPVNEKIEKKINLSNLTKGVYYIRIKNKEINRTQKLIIN